MENLWVGIAVGETIADSAAIIDSDDSANDFKTKYNDERLDRWIGPIVFINIDYEPIEPESFELSFEFVVPVNTDNE